MSNVWESRLRGEDQRGKGHTVGQPLMTLVAWFFPVPGVALQVSSTALSLLTQREGHCSGLGTIIERGSHQILVRPNIAHQILVKE